MSAISVFLNNHIFTEIPVLDCPRRVCDIIVVYDKSDFQNDARHASYLE